MKVVERYRRKTGRRATDDNERQLQERIDILNRQLRKAKERSAVAFDQGFRACLDMMERGSPIDHIREASGVVGLEYSDTNPVSMFDLEEDTQVDAAPLFD